MVGKYTENKPGDRFWKEKSQEGSNKSEGATTAPVQL